MTAVALVEAQELPKVMPAGDTPRLSLRRRALGVVRDTLEKEARGVAERVDRARKELAKDEHYLERLRAVMAEIDREPIEPEGE